MRIVLGPRWTVYRVPQIDRDEIRSVSGREPASSAVTIVLSWISVEAAIRDTLRWPAAAVKAARGPFHGRAGPRYRAGLNGGARRLIGHGPTLLRDLGNG